MSARSAQLLAFLTALATPTFAWAESTDNKVLAEALFEEGKRLLAEGDAARACPKLAASLQLDEGVGTLLALGDCYERQNRTASAWATYREAAALATKQGDRREALARERVARLEPALARLVVEAPRRRNGGLVTLDGKPLPGEALGIAMPVDPGLHVVEIVGPGPAHWRREVHADAGDAPVRVTLPETSPASPNAPQPSRPWGWAQYTGVSVAAAGLVAGAVAAGLAVDARSRYDGLLASGECSRANLCSAPGLAAYDRALSQQSVALGLGIGAAVAVAAGAGLYFLVPRPVSRIELRAGPWLGVSGAF